MTGHQLRSLQNRYLQQIEPIVPGRANFVRYVLKMVTERSYKMMVDTRVQSEWKRHLPALHDRKAKSNHELGVDPGSVLGTTGNPYGLLLVANVMTSSWGMGPTKARSLSDVKPAGIGLDPLDAMIHGFDDPDAAGMCRPGFSGQLHWQRELSSYHMIPDHKVGSYELFWIRGAELDILINPTLDELTALAKAMKMA